MSENTAPTLEAPTGPIALKDLSPDNILVQPHALTDNVCIIMTLRPVADAPCHKAIVIAKPVAQDTDPEQPTPEEPPQQLLECFIYAENEHEFARSTIVSFLPEFNDEIVRQLSQLRVKQYAFIYVSILQLQK